jgi:hypothetical protein
VTLVVRSLIGELRNVPMDTEVASLVAAKLVSEGRAFYSEPWPNNRTRIFCDTEHLERVRTLVKENS